MTVEQIIPDFIHLTPDNQALDELIRLAHRYIELTSKPSFAVGMNEAIRGTVVALREQMLSLLQREDPGKGYDVAKIKNVTIFNDNEGDHYFLVDYADSQGAVKAMGVQRQDTLDAEPVPPVMVLVHNAASYAAALANLDSWRKISLGKIKTTEDKHVVMTRLVAEISAKVSEMIAMEDTVFRPTLIEEVTFCVDKINDKPYLKVTARDAEGKVIVGEVFLATDVPPYSTAVH